MLATLSKKNLLTTTATATSAALLVFATTSASESSPVSTPASANAGAGISAPRVVPDRITLNPTSDNQTTQTVTWRTAPGVTGVAQISPDTSNPWAITPTTVGATSGQPQSTNLGYDQVFHSATFSGLTAGTTYIYRVGDGTNWSGWMPFTTSNFQAKQTSFLAFGDIQRGIKDQWTRVAAAALQDRPDARALISVGDQVNTFNSEVEWDELFTAAGVMPRQMQWIPAVGNHEYKSTDSGELSAQYAEQFDLPEGPTAFPQFKNTVYTTDIDDVRVVTLNSYYRIPRERVDEQRWLDELSKYLDQVLTDNPRRFTIVNMHYPIYSSSPDRGNPELRATLQPVFERHGVDLVLQGHDQAYVSGQRDTGRRQFSPGPVYVTSSSAGRHYPLDYSDWTKNGARIKTAFTSRATYQTIDVKDRTLTYIAKDSTGQVLDQWQIRDVGTQKLANHVGGIGIAKQ